MHVVQNYVDSVGLKERDRKIGRNSDGGRRTGKKLKGGTESRRMGLIIYFVKILKQYKNSKISKN